MCMCIQRERETSAPYRVAMLNKNCIFDSILFALHICNDVWRCVYVWAFQQFQFVYVLCAFIDDGER